MRWPRIDDRVRALSPKLLLFLLLFVALGLRLYGIAWDEGHGFHPDERSIYMRSDCMYNVLVKAPGYSGGDCITQNPEMEPGFPSIGAFLDADKSPLNPHWFPLGSLLIYLVVGIRLVLEPFLDLGSLASMSYIGRSITALADVGTVFIVYLLGKRIYDSRVGLLAAALVTFSVVHIQHAHFYRPEPLLVFFLATSFWFMLQVMERRRLRDSLLLGTFVGLTLATKVSVLPLVLPLILVYGFSLLTTPEARWTVPSRGASNRIVIHAFLAGGAALAGFLITTPYALLDIFNFAGDIWWQATNVAKTAGKVPFTVQYVGTTPFLYELRQTSVWGLGLPLGVVAWGGLLFTIGHTISKVAKLGPVPRGNILLLAWVVPNVAMLSTFEVKFLRYIFPVIPFLVLMGSGTLVWMLDWARTLRPPSVPVAYSVDWTKRRLSKYAPHAVIGVIVFVVTATAFYAVAFERVYAGPHPAVQASRWINENIPNGATILSDTDWDEGIRDLHGYRVQRISIYHRPDDVEKMGTIATQLAGGHYLVFYSNRTYGSVARLPERYPLSSGYYRLLFSGQLGYTPEQVFTSYPRLMGVTFVDDTFTRAGIPKPESLKAFEPGSIALHLGYADENVINYDHPKVLLFRNEGRLSQAQLLDTLTTNLPEGGSQLGLMLGAEEKAVQRQGGTWSDIIKRDSWTNEVPVLAWLLLVELIYLTALPLSTFLFRPLPDRGIVLARVLGILGVSYVAWLLASLGCMGFSRASVLVGILVVALLSSIVLATRWREFKEFVSKNWRLLAIGEAIFLAAFLAFVAIRMANPDLWHSFRGGEKPMDFAYLNAVLRSTSMPPYDPWFAGGYLNYYYWGQFIVATLIKATGIVPSVAYNLAIPLLFALTVTGVYSLVYNIAAGVRRLSPTSGLSLASSSSAEIDFASDQPYSRLETGGGYSPPYRQWRWWVHGVPWGPVIAGLLAGLFVAVIGNLDGIVQVVKGGWNSAIDGQAFPSLDYLSDFWRSSRMLPLIPEIAPSALTFWLDLSNPGVDRILENCPPNGPLDCGHHITEFPFFSFLFADLHAHMIVIPFTMLAVGLGFSLMVGLSRNAGNWWLVSATATLALAVGSLWAINSWDYPTYLILAVILIATGAYLSPVKPRGKLGIFLVLAPGLGLLSYLAFLPFHANYHPFPVGLDAGKWQTPLHNYLGIHGLFLFLIATFLLYQSRDRLKALLTALVHPSVTTVGPSAFWAAHAATLRGIRVASWTTIVSALGALPIIYLAAAGYWTGSLLTVILLFTIWTAKEVLSNRDGSASYAILPMAMIALALCIGIGVEFVRVTGDIGRMNTLFKYYLDAWVLFAMASAYILWYLASKGALRHRGVSIARGGWLAILMLLLVSSFIYPVLGTKHRLADRFSTQNVTLDGADFMKTAVHGDWVGQKHIELRWDYDAIRWLQDNVKGSPVVLEAHTEQYQWGARIANYTGLPTVIGWRWHQTQQRMKYTDAVISRTFSVREMYSTTDTTRALELLRWYEVEYVVVGLLERAYYPAEGLQKFDSMTQEGLAKIAYRNEGTTIYQVLPQYQPKSVAIQSGRGQGDE